jgi:phenylalanyl-tRNA synthetase beta chain
VIAEMGIIDKKISGTFDLSEPVYYADIYWENILDIIKETDIKYQKLSKFPEVRRDLSILIDKNVKFYDLKVAAQKIEKSILNNLFLFDVFENEKIGPDKKSYAIAYIFQDENKTLTDKYVDKIMEAIISMYEKEFAALLR